MSPRGYIYRTYIEMAAAREGGMSAFEDYSLQHLPTIERSCAVMVEGVPDWRRGVRLQTNQRFVRSDWR